VYKQLGNTNTLILETVISTALDSTVCHNINKAVFTKHDLKRMKFIFGNLEFGKKKCKKKRLLPNFNRIKPKM